MATIPVVDYSPTPVKLKANSMTEFHLKLPVLTENVCSMPNVPCTRFQDPVLSAEDVERLNFRGGNKKPLSLLKKVRKKTILLSFPPHDS